MSLEMFEQVVDEVSQSEGLFYLGGARFGSQKNSFIRGWLQESQHAGMRFMENHLHLKEQPELLLNERARSYLSFGWLYPTQRQLGDGAYQVAKYALLPDYHRSLKKKLAAVILRLRDQVDLGDSRACVDTVPIPERELAALCSPGFFGKNSCYIHPRWGSYLLLGTIVSDRELPLKAQTTKYDSRIRIQTSEGAVGCGHCRECQVHCPTGALKKDFTIDSNLCLSYWTIEHRGLIPYKFWSGVGKYYFGCDICQDVCPYNRYQEAPPTQEQTRVFPSIHKIALMTQKEYEQYFGGTALTRAKRSGLIRNSVIAMTVNQHLLLNQVLNQLQDHELEVVSKTVEQARFYLQQ